MRKTVKIDLDPTPAKKGFAARPVQERFEELWLPEPNTGCWLWLGAACNLGYGLMNMRKVGGGRTNIRANRISYEMYIGPIPEGLVIDHKCRLSCCVNPAHLEPVTQAENIRRGSRFKILKTHCVHGHVRTPDNVDDRHNCKTCAVVHKLNSKARVERNRTKTHCLRGHPLDGEGSNVRVVTRNGLLLRQCRHCVNLGVKQRAVKYKESGQ